MVSSVPMDKRVNVGGLTNSAPEAEIIWFKPGCNLRKAEVSGILALRASYVTKKAASN